MEACSPGTVIIKMRPIAGRLIDRIAFALQAGFESTVKPIPRLSMLGSLLLGPLLLGLLFSSALIGPAHPPHQRTCAGANGCTPAGIAGDSPSDNAHGGATSSTP